MAITAFKISTLPKLVELQKNAVIIALDASHPIAEQSDLDIVNNSGFKGENLDVIGYKVSEDGITWSNEAFITIKELVNENTPESANATIAASENTVYDLEDETSFPINTSVDRLKIINITGNGIAWNGDNLLEIGNVIFWKDFQNLEFETKKGAALPYATISYQVGNHLGYNTATTYVITINLSLLGEIEFTSSSSIEDTVDLPPVTQRFSKIDNYKVIKGLIGTQAKINVDINSPMFTDSANNSVILNYPGSEITKSANENFDIIADIDDNGEVAISVEHSFVDVNDTTTSSVVTFVLTEIDGAAANVSATDTVISTANFN